MYVILNLLQNIHFREKYIFVDHFGLKHAEPNFGIISKFNNILITKYLYLRWNIVKSYTFYRKKN